MEVYVEKGVCMKGKIAKLIGIIFLTFCLSIPMNLVTVLADTLSLTELETNEDYATDTVHSMLRGNNLSFGTTNVKKMASNKVGVSGITQCHHTCKTVYLSLYLERKVDGTYSPY